MIKNSKQVKMEIDLAERYKMFNNIEQFRPFQEEVMDKLYEEKRVCISTVSGNGKTTLIKCVLGMVIPDKGNIDVLGENIKKGSNYRHKIDYLPQIANFPSNLRVKELIKMIKDLRGNTTIDEQLIDLFKLTPFLDKKLGNLSGGTKQKVNIVLTFMFDSPLVILDEPTSGLDPISLIRLKDLIQAEKAKGKTIPTKEIRPNSQFAWRTSEVCMNYKSNIHSNLKF